MPNHKFTIPREKLHCECISVARRFCFLYFKEFIIMHKQIVGNWMQIIKVNGKLVCCLANRIIAMILFEHFVKWYMTWQYECMCLQERWNKRKSPKENYSGELAQINMLNGCRLYHFNWRTYLCLWNGPHFIQCEALTYQ